MEEMEGVMSREEFLLLNKLSNNNNNNNNNKENLNLKGGGEGGPGEAECGGDLKEEIKEFKAKAPRETAAPVSESQFLALAET